MKTEKETKQCIFITWNGMCKNKANENGFCEEHEKVKCSCGKQATEFCDYPYSIAVCGKPLCNDCKKIHKH